MSDDSLQAIEAAVLGETEGDIALETSADNAAAVNRLVGQAQRELCIVSRDLDARIYDTSEFVEAVKQLALGNRRAQIRILVQDPEKIVKHGHRLIELMRRLTTFMEIRLLGEEHKHYNDAVLIVDERGYILRDLADRYEGIANFNAQLKARMLMEDFEEMWNHSVADPNFRRLHI